jgi:hypothetical protein
LKKISTPYSTKQDLSKLEMNIGTCDECWELIWQFVELFVCLKDLLLIQLGPYQTAPLLEIVGVETKIFPHIGSELHATNMMVYL